MMRGELAELFSREAVRGVHVIKQALEEELLFLSKDADPDASTIAGHHVLGRSRIGTDGDGRADKKDRDTLDTLTAITAQRQMERLREQLDKLYAERDEIIRRLNEIEQGVMQLREARLALARGELPERDADGRFKDPELEAVVAAEEARRGRSIDRSDPEALNGVFGAAQQRLEGDFEAERDRLRRKNEEIDALEQELDSLQLRRDDSTLETLEEATPRRDLFSEGKTADLESVEARPANKFDGFEL